MAYGINKGDIIEVRLENLAHGGECVGRIEGLAVFVPEGLPGELVRVKVTERKRNFLRGKIEEVIESAPGRIIPECPVYLDCGGCHLQQMDYSLQLHHKREMVRSLLERIGGLDKPEIAPVIGSDYPYAYRNKAQFPLARNQKGEIVAGFYRQGTHEVVAHHDCLIQHPLINRVTNKTLLVLNEYPVSIYNEEKHQGLLRHLVVRAGVCTNQAILTFVTNGRDFPGKEAIATGIMEEVPELVGILQNINQKRINVIFGNETHLIKGEEYYIDYIGNVKFAISPESFFQINTLQTQKLYDVIKNYAGLSGSETVLDAYCGLGSISLYLADRAREINGIEVVEQAIEDARRNAELNGIENCQFRVGRVEQTLPDLIAQGTAPDLLIFDPPRKGLAAEVIEAVLEEPINKIIYVSCNPATLARDLAQLKEKYQIMAVQPVDMFPQTYHVECVVLMQNVKNI